MKLRVAIAAIVLSILVGALVAWAGMADQDCRGRGGVLVLTAIPGWACVEVMR